MCVCFSTALQSYNSTSDHGCDVIAITQMLFGQMPLISLAPKHLISIASHIVIQVGRSRISEAHFFFQNLLLKKMTVSAAFLGKKKTNSLERNIIFHLQRTD